ncbi:MAG: hypothetical protein ABSE84_04535 [Isosphaeraceae bacterium]
MPQNLHNPAGPVSTLSEKFADQQRKQRLQRRDLLRAGQLRMGDGLGQVPPLIHLARVSLLDLLRVPGPDVPVVVPVNVA